MVHASEYAHVHGAEDKLTLRERAQTLQTRGHPLRSRVRRGVGIAVGYISFVSQQS